MAIAGMCPAAGFFRKYSGEYKALVRLGAPVLLTQVGVICVSFADTMMVGLYGVNELAAAAFVNSVFLIPLVMLMGLAASCRSAVRTGQSRRGGTYREGRTSDQSHRGRHIHSRHGRALFLS